MPFTDVCSISDVPDDSGLRIVAGPEPIAVFRIDGGYYAIEDTCPHGDWSLADGYLDGGVIECSLHMAKFCVKTGKVCAPPAIRDVKVFPIRIEGDRVLINLKAEAGQ